MLWAQLLQSQWITAPAITKLNQLTIFLQSRLLSTVRHPEAKATRLRNFFRLRKQTLTLRTRRALNSQSLGLFRLKTFLPLHLVKDIQATSIGRRRSHKIYQSVYQRRPTSKLPLLLQIHPLPPVKEKHRKFAVTKTICMSFYALWRSLKKRN